MVHDVWYENWLPASRLWASSKETACVSTHSTMLEAIPFFETIVLVNIKQIMYTMLFLGIIGAGGCFTGSNPAYTSAELSHHLRTTQTRFLITEPELLPRIAPAIEECSLSVSDVLVFDPTGRDFPLYYRSCKDLLNHGESDWIHFKHHDDSKNTTAALLSTSGTTGLPKAAKISHYNCVSQNAGLNDSKNKPYNVSLAKCNSNVMVIDTYPRYQGFFPYPSFMHLLSLLPT